MKLNQKRAPAAMLATIIAALTILIVSAGCAGGNKKGDSNGKPGMIQPSGKMSVLVLGSGGPVAAKTGRASSGFLIFIDGKPRILMDAGGGTFKSLAQAGINIKDLDIVLLTHLHLDHMGDLSPIIKTMFFHNRGAKTMRKAPIHIYGPSANGIPFPGTQIPQYPSTSEFAKGKYSKESGVARYLHIFARAIKGGTFSYEAHDVPAGKKLPVREIYKKDGLTIKAVGVVHGPVPALAYRIEYGGKSVVYSGDTSSKTGNMAKISRGADLLFYDTAIMDNIPPKAKNKVFYVLHTTPSRMGQVAKTANPAKLVLAHITPVTEPRLDKVKSLVRAQGYKGAIDVASDLKLYNLE